MTEGFASPVLGGGGSLIRPSAHSPGYVAGTTGWTINKDGSAEFNNLVLRGVFDGTDFIMNASGAFFYSGVPAANNLITSIASAPGTDQFGNNYLPGVVTYDTSGNTNTVAFTQILQGALTIGSVTAGVFQSPQDAASFNANTSELNIFTAKDPADLVNTGDQIWEVLFSGKSGATTGGANVPHHIIADNLSTSPVDVWMSGTAIAADLHGTTPQTWQAPAYNANWSTSATFNGSSGNQGLHFRKGVTDNVVFEGMFKAGAVAPGAVLANIAAGYRPLVNKWLLAFRNNGGVVSVFAVQVTTGGNLNIVTTFGGAIAINNEYYIPPQSMPLGNIP